MEVTHAKTTLVGRDHIGFFLMDQTFKGSKWIFLVSVPGQLGQHHIRPDIFGLKIIFLASLPGQLQLGQHHIRPNFFGQTIIFLVFVPGQLPSQGDERQWHEQETCDDHMMFCNAGDDHMILI